MAPRRTRQAKNQSDQPVVEVSAPKATRAPALSRREREAARTTGEKIRRKFDAVPDRIDVRDWFYQPALSPLPDQVVNIQLVPVVLDQGSEGACTGFALASVVNYQLASRNLLNARNQARIVSPRMLYEMARRYDEWPGEDYEGSSARGAMKGWVAHGVASRTSWPDKVHGPGHLTHEIANEAQRTPGGAYYRVMHRNIRDLHSALSEAGIVYATLMVHQGWEEPGPRKSKLAYALSGNLLEIELPIINRKGRADSGHAVALVGYTHEGFIVQNSWGESWGNGGFALLPYEDWMLHATDCWVAQLGVPINFDVWDQAGAADTTAGIHRAGRAIPLSEIRPYVVDIGNNGELSGSGEYWTTKEDLARLFTSIQDVARSWSKRRVLLYLHGGVNDERAVARRIVAFRDVCLENEIYPVHIMWETGFWESLKASILDLFTNKDERAGAGWLEKLREGAIEAKDRTIELTAAAPGTVLWNEMKENGRLASASDGGMRLLTQAAQAAMERLGPAERKKWELHVAAHSAGSIFAAYAIELLVALGVNFKSLQFMAPAIRVDLFKRTLLPHIVRGTCPQPSLYVLSDVGERDDDCGPYGKSLLYLVSNAFEGRRETPILGMERFVSPASQDPNKELVDLEIAALFKKKVDGNPSLVIAGAGPRTATLSPSLSRCNAHGGFDNDEYTLNSVLYRILGEKPRRPFTVRDLQY
jgi:Papain family cysteine protease